MDPTIPTFDPALALPDADASLAAAYAADPIVLTDPDGRVVWVNAAFETLSGYAKEELLGRRPGEVLQGPASDPEARARLRAAIRDGLADRVEIENYRKNGDRYVVEIDLRPVRSLDGEVIRFVAVQRETTARRRREYDLDRRRQLARDLVDASSAGIWIASPVVDCDGRVRDFRWIDANPAAERLIQRSRAEIVGASMLSLFPGAVESGVFDRYADVITTGVEATFEVHYDYDGLDCWYRITALRTGTGDLAVSFLDVTSEKTVSEALRRTRSDLDDLAAQVPGALLSVTVHPNGSADLDTASATLSGLLGYDVAADGLKPALGRLRPSDFLDCVERLAAAPSAPFVARFRYAHPDLGERWLESFARVRMKNGAIRVAAYLHDVTEGHLARAAAEEMSSRLAKLADTVPGVLYQTLFTPDGSMSHPFVSRGSQDLFGLTPDELRQDPHMRLARIAPDDRARYIELLATSRANDTPFWTTIRYDHPERGEVALRVIAQPECLPDGSVLMHKFAADVTDMFQHEQILRAAKDDAETLGRRLSLAASAGRIGFWEFDPETEGLHWDEGMFALFARDPAQFTGTLKDWADAVHPADLEVSSRELASAIQERRQLSVQFRIIRPDGGVRHIVGRAAPYEAADGRLVYLGVNWDATSFVEAQERADAGARAKAAFLANMSHEIRTPMNGVVALARSLAATNLDARQREMVELVCSSGDTLERLLSDILDMSRIEEGKLLLEQLPFDLRETVDSAAQLMQVRADDKGLTFDIAYSPSAQGPFLGDAVRVRQILANLISNAVKFTHSGGVRVIVDVEDHADGSSELRFEVIDTGIGFDEETGRRLFARFEQADASITRTFGGSGLGLAITKALCQAMGGSISAQSHPGLGSRFIVRLALPRVIPLSDYVARVCPQQETVQEVEPVRLEGLRVLLAEDHPTNQRVVSLILEPLGVLVTIASNGAEAVDLFAARRFDVILMDMQMPVLDGLSATRAIRGIERARSLAATPIVMLSANALNEHQVQAREAGCDLHVAKPITPDRLVTVLAQSVALADERARSAA